MATVALPFVNAYRSGGKVFHYYRRGTYRVRLRGEPGSPEFLAAYQEAHANCVDSQLGPKPTKPQGKTLAVLIASYRASPEWKELKPATRKDYEKGLVPLETAFGHLPVVGLKRPHVLQIRNRFAEKPRSANRIVTTLSILLTHAVDLGWREDNPAFRPKRLKTTGEGYRDWTEDEIRQFLAANPDWNLRLLLALCTGQRGEDQIAMTWDAYDGTAVEVVQGKTGAKVWVPCHPALRALLDAAKAVRGEATHILTRQDGEPYKIDHFRHVVGAAIRNAGLKGVVWHGLRTTAATWLAEAGCTDEEIMAITGHKTTQMVRHYTRRANRKRLATAAIGKMTMRHQNTPETGSD
ncbi:site-specific integrase [Roseomonas xinghualingensis]|uniref:site-specific integrase n=1 Tax=Roseomonas xinghualingensis TaxID=2986475 RepID=UPI0021F1E4ED|nr:tyrosine-type recombinase/integrase [Roseomonas sp. SXEYE001]MCV4210077.1 tyrosine-type recombinase/integrase [Roseomonas sp. SXEYE001]